MPEDFEEAQKNLSKARTHHLLNCSDIRKKAPPIVYVSVLVNAAFGVDASRLGRKLARRPQRFQGINFLRLKDEEVLQVPNLVKVAITELPDSSDDRELLLTDREVDETIDLLFAAAPVD